LFVVVDPIGLTPTFLAVTDELPRTARRSVAVRASIIAGAILAGSALIGDWLLGTLGISLAAFRIAGGLLLFSIASEMVLGVRIRREGEAAEQAGKVERSGLQPYFDAIEIVHEKETVTYHRLVEQHKIVKTHGWVVGNSPRSDINPALQAGLNAVFIPHSATWELEKTELESGTGKLLILSTFRELRAHF